MIRALAIGLLIGLWANSAAAEQLSPPLTIAFLGPKDVAEATGAELGIAEANVLGEFTGRRFVLDYRASGTDQPAIALLVVGDFERDAPAGTAVLNLSDDRDSLRSACEPGRFHVLPSASMAKTAESRWRQRHPASSARAVAWHPDFVKFAARDLNKRYRKKYDAPMGPRAWLGWVAVKAVVEASTRSNASDPAKIAAYMRDSLEFDGQKGIALSFGQDGQLRQPLLLIQDEQIVGETSLSPMSDACGRKPGED